MADVIAEVLRTLQAERAKIDAAIRALQNGQPATSDASGHPTVLDGRFTGKSLSVAAKTVLAEAGCPMHVNDIVAEIEKRGLVITSADKPNNVGAVLNGRMKRRGDVKRVERGTWQIVDESDHEPNDPFDD